MPDSVTRRMQTVNSNYDTDTWGLQTALAKTLGRHDLSAPVSTPAPSKTQRPFSQSPIPQRLARDHAAGGRQPQLLPLGGFVRR